MHVNDHHDDDDGVLRSALCSHPLPTLMNNLTRGAAAEYRHTTPNSHSTASTHVMQNLKTLLFQAF